MPLPARYEGEVPEIARIWKPEGYARAQGRIWLAQTRARHELYGDPTAEEVEQIERALVLTPEDLADFNKAEGHETNKLLRKVQSRLRPELGNYIHRGNTSSDILDTGLALQIRESLDVCEEDFGKLSGALLDQAKKHRRTLQIARTHGQHAIPQTFGRQVLGWYSETTRGMDRFKRAKEVIAVGKCSGEVGTNVFIDPKLEERSLVILGLKPDPAPAQIISRDRHAEVTSLMAVNGGTLERITTDIRLLAMTDIGEVQEPFDQQTKQGSSAMPHKRNPDVSERVAGLNRIIRGSAAIELETMPSWLERDISHSSTERFSFPDQFGALDYATKLTTGVIADLVVFPDRMRENMNRTYGAIYSSRLLNTMVDAGMGRTQAYDLVKKLSQQAMDEKTPLKRLASQDPQISGMIKKKQMNEIFSPDFYLKNIDTAYERLGITK